MADWKAHSFSAAAKYAAQLSEFPNVREQIKIEQINSLGEREYALPPPGAAIRAHRRQAPVHSSTNRGGLKEVALSKPCLCFRDRGYSRRTRKPSQVSSMCFRIARANNVDYQRPHNE